MAESQDLDQYTFTFLSCKDFSMLRSDWLRIENESKCSIFLSWVWISTWIETYQPETKILRAYYKKELVGVAVFVFNKQKRHYILISNALYLHQTGDQKKDQIWIEYNGILAKQEHKQSVTEASIRYLLNITDKWDELVLSAITMNDACLLEDTNNLLRYDLWETPCYGIDLKTIRANNKDYLSTLSRNTRYQIKRSIRLYENSGNLFIETANSKTTALEYFRQIGPLHIDRWGDSDMGSGFANPCFISFHERFIHKCWENGLVDLKRIKVGERVIAVFYNFIYRNNVYFYINGLISEDNSKLKPGLTGHSLCVQKYLNDGMEYYDFMGGNERYKSNLATVQQHLVSVTLQKRKLKYILERFGRKIKLRLKEIYA